MNNPFEILEQRLDNIETSIAELAKKPEPEPETQPREKFLTTEQVAEMLGVSRVTL